MLTELSVPQTLLCVYLPLQELIPRDCGRRQQFMWFNMANKKLTFPKPPNITSFKIEITYTEFVVI